MNDVFYEIFRALPRQGPGLAECTLRAFRALKDLPAHPRILDIGCGSGMQTMTLAGETDGSITALDNYPAFLNALAERAAATGMSERIRCVEGDLFHIEYPPHSFDLLWSEGSIFLIGFERGLRGWKPLLRPGGYMVVSDLTWLCESPSDEIRSYMSNLYGDLPMVPTVNECADIARRAGYQPVDSFSLPERGWWEDFYTPMEEQLRLLRRTRAGDPEAMVMVSSFEREIGMFRRHGSEYGYTFFVLRNVA
jgi:ubiquinone/menaquinone biosynthesis C-methylase UbiE